MTSDTHQVMPHIWPTVVHMLADAAERSPDHPALICDEESVTYRQYASCVAGLAAELIALEAGRHSRVALVMSNSLDIAIATFAVQAAGSQVVPLNPAYTSAELGPMLDNADCKVIIYDFSAKVALEPLLGKFQPDCCIEVGENDESLTRWRRDLHLAAQLPFPPAERLAARRALTLPTKASRST
jgi:long-chain acyl-CoA synthetase